MFVLVFGALDWTSWFLLLTRRNDPLICLVELLIDKSNWNNIQLSCNMNLVDICTIILQYATHDTKIASFDHKIKHVHRWDSPHWHTKDTTFQWFISSACERKLRRIKKTTWDFGRNLNGRVDSWKLLSILHKMFHNTLPTTHIWSFCYQNSKLEEVSQVTSTWTVFCFPWRKPREENACNSSYWWTIYICNYPF